MNSVFKRLCDAARIPETFVFLQRSDLLVLNYHGVLTHRRSNPERYVNEVDADSFRSQLRWLKRHLVPVGLEGLRDHSAGQWKQRKPPVLITFDDGYRNNLTVAAPILLAEKVPAIFFLSTGYVGTPRVLWNDEVRVRVRNWPEPSIKLPSGETRDLPAKPRQRRAFSGNINQACKHLTEERLAEYLDYLRGNTSTVEIMDDPEARAFMNWDEARELSRMGFEIGSHTVEHPILSQISRERVVIELRESKATIERELDRPCPAIAYPNGSANDMNGAVLEEVRDAGYGWGFMTIPTWQKPDGDRHQIARIGCPGHTNLATFKFYASGLHTRLSGTR